MALYGAFSSSILGMMSQSYALGTISTNIANMNTGGYRATETRFETVFSDSLFAQSDLGGVKPKDVRRMDSQGNMVASTRDLDVAINGKGFFMVSPTLDAEDIYYTRDGSFDVVTGDEVTATADDGSTITVRAGYLADKNGNYVLGWPVEPDGTFNTDADPAPIRVDEYTYVDQGQATNEATAVLNIPSTAVQGDTYEYHMDVYDSEGVRQTAVLHFTKSGTSNVWDFDVTTGNAADAITVSPTRDFSLDTGTEAVFTANAVPGDGSGTITVRDIATQTPVTLDGLNVGDTISIAGTASNNGIYTITAIAGGVLTVAEDIAAEIDGDGMTLGSGSDFSYTAGTRTAIDTAAGTITVQSNGGTPLTNAFAGLNAGDTITLTGTTGNDGSYVIGSVSADGSTITVDATTPLPGANEVDADGVNLSAPGALVERLEFTSTGGVSSPDTYTLDIAWASGGTNSIALDLSNMTQFSNGFLVNSYAQNGYGSAAMKGFSFDSNGHVLGRFDDASDRPLYQLALSTFTNPAGLKEMNGNLFAESVDSGEPRIAVPGEGTADLSPNTLELSNVDVADEFTRMIMTQHAYTSSATVFKTVDEMTKEARDLKR